MQVSPSGSGDHGSDGGGVAGVAPALGRPGEHRRGSGGLSRALRAAVCRGGSSGRGPRSTCAGCWWPMCRARTWRRWRCGCWAPGPGAEGRVRALQHFIGEGAWDDDAAPGRAPAVVDETLGDGGRRADHRRQRRAQAGHALGGGGPPMVRGQRQEGQLPGRGLPGLRQPQGRTPCWTGGSICPRAWFTPAYQERWRACAIPPDTPFQTKHGPGGGAGGAGGASAGRCGRAGWPATRATGTIPPCWRGWTRCGLWYLAEVPCATQVWPLAEPATGRTPGPRHRSGCRRRPPRAKGRRRAGAPAPGQPARSCGSRPSPPPCRPPPGSATASWRAARGRWWPTSPPCARWRCATACPAEEVWVLLRRNVTGPAEAPDLKYYL